MVGHARRVDFNTDDERIRRLRDVSVNEEHGMSEWTSDPVPSTIPDRPKPSGSSAIGPCSVPGACDFDAFSLAIRPSLQPNINPIVCHIQVLEGCQEDCTSA